MPKMKANLFIFLPHAWRFSYFLAFPSPGGGWGGRFLWPLPWCKRGNRLWIQIDLFVMICETWRLSRILYWQHPNPSKSSQFEKIRQWKATLEVELFMYDNNDVIRKKIILISSLPCRKKLFSLSHHDFT